MAFILIHFVVRVIETLRELSGNLRDHVLVVSLSPLFLEVQVREVSIGLVTHSWLPEVVHVNLKAVVGKHHTSQLRECSTQRMTSCLDCVVRVFFAKTFNFLQDVTFNSFGSILEAIVDFTVTVGPINIVFFVSIQVGYPVF